MRRISFSMTKQAVLDGTKTVTRRLGWKTARPQERLVGVEKAQGLKKGEHQVVLRTIEVVSNAAEALREIVNYPNDCVHEGFPQLRTDQFIEMFCRANRCEPKTIVQRIRFLYVCAACNAAYDPASPGADVWLCAQCVTRGIEADVNGVVF